MTGGTVLHYSLATNPASTGSTSASGPREHEGLRFSLDYDGREQATSRIKLGVMKEHPPFATFLALRSA
ncbi:MAG: hypothetical protein ACREPI_03980 [Candidatus Dormibacterales bacterium]